jgi:hypothetical protein
MGRILHLIAAFVILYATVKTCTQPPRRKNPAYVAGYYTGFVVIGGAGLYCLFKAASPRS